MSQLRKVAISIKNLNAALAQKTIMTLASRHGLTASDSIRDFNGTLVKVTAGLSGAGVRGFGIVRNTDGTFSVIGDDYNQTYTLQQFQQEFQQAYTALAYQQALAALGYATQAQAVKINGKLSIAIRGTKP